MSSLREIVADLKNARSKPTARCAITTEGGFAPESSLMGTRDGYLNLAIALLETVVASEGNGDSDVDAEPISEARSTRSDNIKKALHQLPTLEPYIVGCYLFNDHQSFLAALEQVVNPNLPEGVRLSNDPAFKET